MVKMKIPKNDACHMRVVTYNIHKCRGLDGRVRPERIAKVLRELDADIIALQEVLSHPGDHRGEDHARFIAEELGFQHCFGENRKHLGQSYGNALLSRFPLSRAWNYDITVPGREARGCLRLDITLPGGAQLHFFNVHLGTSFPERRQQVRKLISSEILNHPELAGARIVLGDFNDWTSGAATRALHEHFGSPHPQARSHRKRTYPGVLPFFHLDQIFFDPKLSLRRSTVHKSLRALVASDHLPLVAELSLSVAETPDARPSNMENYVVMA
jgi:endonuclease/exonuclease/phosphatase family metal-dependent hydrolase